MTAHAGYQNCAEVTGWHMPYGNVRIVKAVKLPTGSYKVRTYRILPGIED